MGVRRLCWPSNVFCLWCWKCYWYGWLGWLGSGACTCLWVIKGCAPIGIGWSGGVSIVPYRHAYCWLVEGWGILSWRTCSCGLWRLLDICGKFWCIRHRKMVWWPLMIVQSQVRYRLLMHWLGGHKGGLFYIVLFGFHCRLQLWFFGRVEYR